MLKIQIQEHPGLPGLDSVAQLAGVFAGTITDVMISSSFHGSTNVEQSLANKPTSHYTAAMVGLFKPLSKDAAV